MPPSSLLLSVFVTDGLSTTEIHEHGERHAPRQGEPPKAYGVIAAQAVLHQKLRIDRDDNPPLHANVIGWPNEKSERKSIAQHLAAAASLHIRP